MSGDGWSTTTLRGPAKDTATHSFESSTPIAAPSAAQIVGQAEVAAVAVDRFNTVVGCNRAGAEPDGGGTRFGGHSAAVDPWARVLVEGGAEPGLLVARLDLAEVDRARRLFPFWQDRRPEVYG